MAEDWAGQLSLISDEPLADKVFAIDTDRISSNPFQPRREFNKDRIEELARSIEACGLIQPIVVRRATKGYEVVVGERRLMACRSLGWKKITAAVVSYSDDIMAAAALIENLQRENLNYIEEATGYVSLMDRFKITQEVLARRLGKSQSTIANKLRLLKLPQKVRSELLDKQLSERHARALLVLKSESEQLAMIEEMGRDNLTVSQAEQRIGVKTGRKMQESAKKKARPVVRDWRIVLNTMREAVSIVNNAGLYPEVTEHVEDDYVEIRIRLTRDMLVKKKQEKRGHKRGTK